MKCEYYVLVQYGSKMHIDSVQGEEKKSMVSKRCNAEHGTANFRCVKGGSVFSEL